MRELVVLGTSSQVPTRYRNHNGYLLLWDGQGILFDPGEGTQRQMTLAGVRAHQIHRICVTHFHGDHCLGLAGITQRISLDGVPHPVPVHFPRSGHKYYDRLRKASIFKDRAQVHPAPIDGGGVIAKGPGWRLEALALDHGVETFGYRLVEPDSVRMVPERLAELGVHGPAVGQLKRHGQVEVDGKTVRVEDASEPRRGQVVAFVMDTRVCDNAYALAEGADLLICESTYLHSERVEARDHGHMTATEAAKIARDAGAAQLLLTHFSQRYPSTKPFVAEARAIFENADAAVDLMRVPIRR